ncbi:protein phosphatase regulatory subunit Sds22 [Candidozyma auris]|uniref:Protein phosphatase 1 regulatory subunit 7 n=1 Tax=Candidozyma auris TaxID=498019 RepID=A0A2H0ZTN4_CANAR|nr:hypothetical protein QG37_04843 [[Candida] auris]PIS52015.1 hypothetical protein B9J08_003626 [[Candida] auris]PIS54001.1 hypothetical protein CJI97_003699 [[Candida] auris]
MMTKSEEEEQNMLNDQTEALNLSQTDEEHGGEESGPEEEDNGAVEYPGTVLPDPHPQSIENDADLAAEYPSDSEYLDLIHLKITSLEDLNLSRFKKLESLCLRQNLITSIGAVADLPVETMEELDFYDNRINHISSKVNQLVNLKNLDFSFNNIKNIKNIDKLVNLENLYFVQNKIREIKGIETLQKLRNLELGGNKIEEINEVLLKLPSIEQLWLGKNRIAKFQNLDNLVNLRVLSIQSNRITKLEGLDKLVNLEELYVSHNGIEKIENLDKNTNLTVLDVTSNRIEKLENLSHLKKLTDFWCSYNKISSFEEVHKELGGLPELDTVYFEGNPLHTSNPTAYRRKLRLNLGSSITKIDATYVKG